MTCAHPLRPGDDQAETTARPMVWTADHAGHCSPLDRSGREPGHELALQEGEQNYDGDRHDD